MKAVASATSMSFNDLQMLSIPQVEVQLPEFTLSGTPKRVIRKIMCANRGEIAVRIFRATKELSLQSVAIYSHEDAAHLFRFAADEAYEVGHGKSPVGAYLDIQSIIDVAKAHDVDAIHPGYGFLSENAEFARACEAAGIVFVGPTPETIDLLGDKTKARDLAIQAGVPVVPGTDGPVKSFEEAEAFVKSCGLPVIIKAAMGGGGRGMRIVREMSGLRNGLERAQSEAKASFGDATVFIERLVNRPRHIEVQIIGDGKGNVQHLFERDCSVQRRHQKVVEVGPAGSIPGKVKHALYSDAIKLANAVKYRSAGTVEFLVDSVTNEHFFIEVNPRIQVEHTVTEEITGVDIVQAQLLVAHGLALHQIDSLHNVSLRACAIQCRLTTEDPKKGFLPDTGTINLYRAPGGMGIRMDGVCSTDSVITPHYDSLLVKITARGLTHEMAARKLVQALGEMRVRGVKTNAQFLLRVLASEQFLQEKTYTTWVDETPSLFEFKPQEKSNTERLLHYLGDMVVNGSKHAGAVGPIPTKGTPPLAPPSSGPGKKGWRAILKQAGPKGFARAIREFKQPLLTDTTWRDAHQSLLATRLRTVDMLNVAQFTSNALSGALSLECWGGATFDVCLRFLHECPWERLRQLRKAVPNVPFQMLLRGANAVGYTAYPDNVLLAFCQRAVEEGMDIFRIFDSLNFMENLVIGIQSVVAAGGVAEGTICYTGDLCNPKEKKYTLEYYLAIGRGVVEAGAHIIGVKDMAGLLKPQAARILISALREEFPDIPIHVHTHDTAGTGVSSMLACLESGADIVDAAIDSMSGLTSQPSMGAIVGALQATGQDPGIKMSDIYKLNNYWESVRALYSQFDIGPKSGSSEVYNHQMPGGQYTNLMFQSNFLGLAGRWEAVKAAYAEANQVLGNIVKVTPSSKVVGDLAQFMVANNITTADQLRAQARSLSFPQSVVNFLQGDLGIPHGGFPEPFRSDVIKDLKKIEGRPGAKMPPLDLPKLRETLQAKYPTLSINDNDVLSAALYPQVFDEFANFILKYGFVGNIPTYNFLVPMRPHEVFEVTREKATKVIQLLAVGDLSDPNAEYVDVFFNVDGRTRSVDVRNERAASKTLALQKADTSNPFEVAAPMPGVIIDLKVKQGDPVVEGQPLVVLSAMKMETLITSPCNGVVKRISEGVGVNTQVAPGDLLMEMGEPPSVAVSSLEEGQVVKGLK